MTDNNELVIGTDLHSLGDRLTRTKSVTRYHAGLWTNIRFGLLALTIALAIPTVLGDGIEKREACFYPETAQNHDDGAIRTNRQFELNRRGKVKSEKELLFGSKYCTPRQRHLFPLGFIRKAQRESSNPDYNPYAAFAVDGFNSKGVYVFRQPAQENPWKGLATYGFIASAVALLAIANKEKSVLDQLRPQYWASLEIQRITADKFITMSSDALQEWVTRMTNLFAGVKEAKLRLEMWASLNETERELLDIYLSESDKKKFGFFQSPPISPTPQQQLPYGNPGTYQEMIQQPAMGGNGGASYDFHPSENQSRELLQAIAQSDGSTILVAAPGAGKSVTLNEIIRRIKMQPQADIKVLSKKPDDFCGLRGEGRTFSAFEVDLSVIKSEFDEFYAGYQNRGSTPEHLRAELPPKILILDDWVALSDKLSTTFPDWDYGGMILDILTVGRDYNVKVLISLQSFNLQAIGIKKMDSNIRQIFNIILLGNHYIKQGRSQSSYGVIENLIKNQFFIPDNEQRQAIGKGYAELKPISFKNMRPICVAYCGEFWLGIMPNLVTSNTESKVLPLATPKQPDEPHNPTESDAEKLNNLLDQKPALTQPEDYILKWVYMRKEKGQSYDIRTAIQNLSRRLESPNTDISKSSAIRYYFQQLVVKEYGRMIDDDNFEPNNF